MPLFITWTFADEASELRRRRCAYSRNLLGNTFTSVCTKGCVRARNAHARSPKLACLMNDDPNEHSDQNGECFDEIEFIDCHSHSIIPLHTHLRTHTRACRRSRTRASLIVFRRMMTFSINVVIAQVTDKAMS